MKSLLAAAVVGFSSITPVLAADPPELKEYRSWDSMGCMLLQECTDDVVKITTTEDLRERFPDVDYSHVEKEFDQIVYFLDELGINVYLAPEKYFPPRNRGVYHTVSNHFYLNDDYMHSPTQLIQVVRHEGWHAVQDCMAGSLDNTQMAIVFNEEEIPTYWRDLAERTYVLRPGVLPWEQEAMWAGNTKDVTVKGLEACASPTPIWEVYEPTPMTREWLVDKGYIK